jgi:hypothetical protein
MQGCARQTLQLDLRLLQPGLRVPVAEHRRGDRVRAGPTSLLPIDVQANLLLSVKDGDTPLRRGDDDGLPGRRRPKLFREVHRDGQLVPSTVICTLFM